jgi:hypothetical protein
LKSEFLTLYQDYGAVLDSVEQESDISSTKIRRVSQHLRVYSDEVLTKCGKNHSIIDASCRYFIGLS